MCATHLDFFILGESFRVRAANPTYLSPPGGRKSQTSSAPFLGSRMLWECKVWALMTSELRFYNPYKKSCFHEWAVQSNKKLYGLFCLLTNTYLSMNYLLWYQTGIQNEPWQNSQVIMFRSSGIGHYSQVIMTRSSWKGHYHLVFK